MILLHDLKKIMLQVVPQSRKCLISIESSSVSIWLSLQPWCILKLLGVPAAKQGSHMLI